MRYFVKKHRDRPGRGARRRVSRCSGLSCETLEGRAMLAAGPLGMNVLPQYVDAMNQAQDWQSGDPNFGRDANGWPTTDGSVVVLDDRVNQWWNGPDPNAVPADDSGVYHLSFTGQASVSSFPATVSNQVYNPATNTTTADVTEPPGNPFLMLYFNNTQRTPGGPTDTGVTNVRLIRPGYDPNTTQLFTTNFLNAVAPFGTLRYMDATGTNYYPSFNGTQLSVLDWSQRRLPSDSSQSDSFGGKVDQSWEYMIQLANATNTDMWINIPGPANDNYVTQLANLIKNGDTVNGVYYPGLNPNLKVYVEYSNEVWGGIQNTQVYNKVAAIQEVYYTPGETLNSDGSTDQNVWAGRRYLERTMQITNIFRSVLGADPTYSKIRPVLGWQEGNSNYFETTFPWFESNYGAPSQYFYGMGNANYWGATDYSSVDSTINSLASSEASSRAATLGFTTIADYYGLQNVAYEGGPGLNADPNTPAGQNALAASRDPRIESLIATHYLNWYADGGGLAMFYNGPYAVWPAGNEWSAAELSQAANPSLSAKYRGLVDVANAAPPAVTAGVAISSTTPTVLNAATDFLGEGFSSPSDGQDGFWLLNVSTPGVYNLTLTTGAGGGSEPGQVQVFLKDGQQVGGTFNVSANGTIDLGNLTLGAGLTTLRIHTVKGTNDPAYPSDANHYLFQPQTLTLTPLGPVTPPPGPPPLIDTTTLGNWPSAYGSDGSMLAGGSSPSLPSYAQVSLAGASSFTWGTNTGSPYALRNAAGTGDLAATWYSPTSFDINLHLTDGQAHQVSLYALDWDNVEGNPYPLRSERFDVLDASTGAVLASQTISSFKGEYVNFTLSGSVVIRVTNLTAPGQSSNAVVSGIFFG